MMYFMKSLLFVCWQPTKQGGKDLLLIINEITTVHVWDSSVQGRQQDVNKYNYPTLVLCSQGIHRITVSINYMWLQVWLHILATCD